MDRTRNLETWNEGIKYQKIISIADVCNHFFYHILSVRGGAWSLFIKSDMLIWILLYKDLFKNETFLLLMYKNYLK